MVYTTTIFSATREIKGLVTSDEDNMPLIGASVFVAPDDLKKINYPKESIGVMTAIDGSFIINVPDNITRIFCSYLGHNQQEIKLGKETFYNIKLESSSHELDNIVVTGYQKIERRKLTAAISSVKITDEMIGNTHSIDQILAGQIAGLSAVTSTGAPGAPVKTICRPKPFAFIIFSFLCLQERLFLLSPHIDMQSNEIGAGRQNPL